MPAFADNQHDQRLNEMLAISGFRFTPQRRHVYNVLLEDRSHPTADEVYLQAKPEMPEISLATVYNCLDALVKSGLVRQVHLERAAWRYCANMSEHSHFYCEGCGGVFDVEPAEEEARRQFRLPDGFTVKHSEVSFRGVCGRCATGEAIQSKNDL